MNNDELPDTDMSYLEGILLMLDEKIKKFDIEIKKLQKQKIDADFYYDKVDYLVGFGFVAWQKYLSATYSLFKIKKNIALSIEPYYINKVSIPLIIDAVANYWEHCDEWQSLLLTPNSDTGMTEIEMWSKEFLTDQQDKTSKILEAVIPWHDYTCANILYELSSSKSICLIDLVSYLKNWQSNLKTRVVI